ncbi:MAG: diguanylate cyclase, partial [Pseudomonadota bacterium]
MPTAEPDQALLICADAETSRRARDALQAAGLDVCGYAGADEALRCLHGVVPRVVVIDDELDDPAGLCGQLRGHDKCRYVPIIRLSGDDGREALHRAYDEGFTTVFIKPLSHEFLRARFSSYARTGRTISGLNALHDGAGPVLQAIPDVFLELSSKGIVRRFLGGADECSRWSRAAAEGHSVDALWPGDTATLIRREIRRALTTRESHAFEFDSGAFEMRLLVQGRDRLLAIIRDTAEFPLHGPGGRVGAEDTLTGLTRREVFMRDLAGAIDDARLRERRFALMCIDLDDFSAINDTLGRPFGDTVLRVSGERLQRCLRSDDALTTVVDDDSHVARSGGDEFVAMLPDIASRQTAAAVAERIGAAFAEPVANAGSSVTVTPSIGIAVFPGDATDAETLLLAARSALDEARSNDDVGFAFYSDTLRLKALSRPDVGDELRWAIDKQQLDIHYLPRIDLASGSIVALEGLLRWEHPLRGMVQSGEIVPLAEVTGLMSRIGEWVIHAACAHARRWRDETG